MPDGRRRLETLGRCPYCGSGAVVERSGSNTLSWKYRCTVCGHKSAELRWESVLLPPEYPAPTMDRYVDADGVHTFQKLVLPQGEFWVSKPPSHG